MKKQNKKLVSILAFCILGIAVLFLAVPSLLDFNIGYKNKNIDIRLPTQEISQDILDIEYTLPVVYLYSYEPSKLIASWVPPWANSPDSELMPKREESKVDVYVFNRRSNVVSDIPTNVYLGTSMKLRGRTSSYVQEKRPFSMEFQDKEGNPVDWPFLDLKAESDFVFGAPYIDRSIIRNYVAYKLQKKVLDWAPDCQFAEVFIDSPNSTLNSGDYVGVYLITEKIKKGKNRLSVGDFKVAKKPEDQFSKGGGYIFKRDAYEIGYDTAIRLPENAFGNSYSLASPKAGKCTEEEVQVIFDEIEKYEEALYNGTDTEFSKYYDIEQFARCMLVDELLKNSEGFSSSTYFYRAKGEKLKVVQWDFDIGTGNVDYDKNLGNAGNFQILNLPHVKPFLNHENFKKELVYQWETLRGKNGALSEENIIALLDDAEQQLDGAWQRNEDAFPRLYGDINSPLIFGNAPNDLKNSQEERAYIKQFLIERGRWIDEHLDDIL